MWALNLFWGVSESISKVSAFAEVKDSIYEQKKSQIHSSKLELKIQSSISPSDHKA